MHTDHRHRTDQGTRRQGLEFGLQAAAAGQLVGADMGAQHLQARRLLCVRRCSQPADHRHWKILDRTTATALPRRKCDMCQLATIARPRSPVLNVMLYGETGFRERRCCVH